MLINSITAYNPDYKKAHAKNPNFEKVIRVAEINLDGKTLNEFEDSADQIFKYFLKILRRTENKKSQETNQSLRLAFEKPIFDYVAPRSESRQALVKGANRIINLGKGNYRKKVYYIITGPEAKFLEDEGSKITRSSRVKKYSESDVDYFKAQDSENLARENYRRLTKQILGNKSLQSKKDLQIHATSNPNPKKGEPTFQITDLDWI